MSWNVTHVLVATALLVGPATLGVASHSDQIETAVFAEDDRETAAEAEEIDVFEGEVPEGVTSAKLDLRIDRGPVQVIAWDKPRYEIKVLQAPADGPSPGQTETSFEENVEEDVLSLELVVDRDGQVPASGNVQGTSVGDQAERAIVAHVPAQLAYTDVFACEGEGYDSSNGTLPVTGEVGDAECVADDSPGHDQVVYAGTSDESALNVTAGLTGIQGQTAQLAFDNQDLELTELDLETLKASTDNGDIDVAANAQKAQISTDNGQVTLAGEISALDVHSDNGDIEADLPALTKGSIVTDNGAITAQVAPADSGELTVTSDNGQIDVGLAHEDGVGYKADGTSENGEVSIALVDERSSDDGAIADEDDYEHGESESAHTAGYDGKPVQFDLSAETENGQIQIVEETASTDDGGDESGSGSVGSIAR